METDRGTIACDTVVIAAGAAAGAVGALAGAAIPVVPMRHQYVVTEPLAEPVEGTPDGARPRPHHLLPPRSRRRAAGRRLRARPGDLGRGRAAGASRARCSTPTWTRFAESWEGARRARARAARRARSRRWSTAPRRSRPTASSCSARPRCGGLWVAAGFCVHGLAGAGGVGKVMAEWIAGGRARVGRVGDGHPPLRRATTRGRAYARVQRAGRLLALLRHRLSRRGARGRAARCASRPPTRGCARWARRSARRPAGSGRTGSRPTRRRATRRCARAAGRGATGRPAIGAECLAARDRAALFDQSSFAKLDVERARARPRR